MANHQFGGQYQSGPSFGRNNYENNAPPSTFKPAQNRLMQDRQQPLLARTDKQFNVNASAYSELSDDQKEEINEAFTLFDLNKDGYVDYHELRVAFKALGFNVDKPRLIDILTRDGIAATSISNPGAKPVAQSFVGPDRLLLARTSFQNIVSTMIAERPPEVEVERAFQLFVPPGQDKIGIEDLQRVANELGENLSEEELHAMIDEFDMDGDGYISKDDFISICMG